MPHAAAKALVIASVAVTMFAPGNAAKSSRQSAVVQFDRPTWVATALLMGRYVIEHDDERMAHGASCTTVYRMGHDGPIDVVSFHCTPRRQPAPKHFRVSVIPDPLDGRDTLTAYQFTDDPEVHGVPVARLGKGDERQTLLTDADGSTDLVCPHK